MGTSTGSVAILRGPRGGSSSSTWQQSAQLKAGKGPVLCLAFAPAQHGLLLAVAGSDGSVCLHEEGEGGAWTLLGKLQVREGSLQLGVWLLKRRWKQSRRHPGHACLAPSQAPMPWAAAAVMVQNQQSR